MKQKIEITVEIRRRLLINRRGTKIVRAWCGGCLSNRRMVPAEHAAGVCGLSLRKIFRHVEEGQIHFLETPHGLFLCLHSICELLQRIDEAE